MRPAVPPRGATCPPAIELERAAVSDVTAAVEAHLPGCERCRGYVAELVVTTDAFLAARPAERFVSQLDARARGNRRRLVGVAAAAVAVAAGLLVVVALPPPTPVRFKGAMLSITVKRNADVTPLSAGDVLRSGDALRFSVNAPRSGFAAVVNRDGQGVVAVVAPFQAQRPQAVPAGATTLDDSAVVDDAQGPERFFLVFSERAFELAPLLVQTSAGQTPSCAGCVVEAAQFEKR